MKPRFPLFERWEPHQLGHSLPIAGRLRLWATGLAIAWLAAAALVAWVLWDLGRPGTDPAEASYVRQVALERLARTELPVWSPGGPLEASEAPGYAPPPPPPPAVEPHPGDPPLRPRERLGEALAALESGDALAAATDLAEMAEDQPTSWLLAYDAGLGYLAAGFHDRAGRSLGRARDRLDAYAAAYGNRPEHHAAAVATRYAAAHALRRDDCVGAIRQLKLGVRDLRRFVDAGGARTFDRRLPYRLAPLPLSNLDVWSALVESYLGCDAYPAEYFSRYSDPGTFRATEYADPDAADVREGPFPRQLAACIDSDGAAARCWALSNLNALYLANRSLLERDGDLPPAFEPHRTALARLAYDTALLAATGPAPVGGGEGTDLDNAPEILLQARRLGSDDGALEERIDLLARHLGGALQDYRVWAERYRGRDVDDLEIAPTTPEDELKGMAWALREGWQQHLAGGAPGPVFGEVAELRRRLPAAYLDSLKEWEGDARRALRDALADEIRVQKRRGNRAMAAGLRDFRAEWLGEGWPDRAAAAWWTPGLRAARWGLLLALALLLAALAYAYRYAVYPYVLHTADLYRPELDRRRRHRQARDLPVTGDEIYERERYRRGEMP